jgi:cytidylate kinase
MFLRTWSSEIRLDRRIRKSFERHERNVAYTTIEKGVKNRKLRDKLTWYNLNKRSAYNAFLINRCL